MNHVLIVLPNDSLGGAEQVLKMIAQNFKNSKVEIRFLKQKQSKDWNTIPSHVQLSYQDVSSEFVGMLFFVLSFFFKPARKYDYVFTSHVFVTGMIGVLIRLGFIKKKYFVGRESTQIFDRFSGLKLFLYKKMYQFGYPCIDLLICQTDQMRLSLLKNLPWIDKKILVKVIPNPIDLSQINVTDIDTQSPFLVSAGRLIPEKGFDILIEAFKDFIKKYPTYQLIILGEGKERLNLENQIRNLKLERKVILKGQVSNVYSYFKKADLCVVSSRIEGFPNVLLQMMSQNDKVVTTRCAGDLDKIAGVYLADTSDSKSLSYAMQDALCSNTLANKLLFETFLNERSINIFLQKVEKELS